MTSPINSTAPSLVPARAPSPDEVQAQRVVSDLAPPDTGEAQALRQHPRAAGHLRSFALRASRLTDAQRIARLTLLPRHGIAYQPAATDFHGLFGRVAPLVVEIGCGMGETTAKIAAADPARDYIGIEVYTAGVGSLLRRIEDSGLRNLRVIQHDAVEVLRDMVPAGTLDAVHVFFPDPWHKARHHKRRLIQPALVALLAARLRPGGLLHCATDWEPYAEQMLAVLDAEPLLRNTAGSGYAPRPAYRPLTKFEQRGLRLGHGVRDLVYARREP